MYLFLITIQVPVFLSSTLWHHSHCIHSFSQETSSLLPLTLSLLCLLESTQWLLLTYGSHMSFSFKELKSFIISFGSPQYSGACKVHFRILIWPEVGSTRLWAIRETINGFTRKSSESHHRYHWRVIRSGCWNRRTWSPSPPTNTSKVYLHVEQFSQNTCWVPVDLIKPKLQARSLCNLVGQKRKEIWMGPVPLGGSCRREDPVGQKGSIEG